MEMSLFSLPTSVRVSRLTFHESSKATVNVEESTAKLEPFTLHYLYSAMFATILEDIITELRVLEECNNKLRIMKVYADYSKLLGKKFGVEHRYLVDELETIDHKDLEKEEYKVHKIEDDRKLIVEKILNTYQELSLQRRYSSLVKTVNAIQDQDKRRAELILEESKNRSIRRELARQLRQQRNHYMSVNYDTDVVIDVLRNRIEDANLVGETRSRYVTKWQIARTEQHRQTIKDIERTPAVKVEYYKQKIDQESRIHQEVELLIAIINNDCLQQIDDWMTKYDIDLEAADLKVQIMKNRYQDQRDDRLELERKFAKHKELMADWIKYKDDRAKANAYRVKMTQSAIVVQAWWRGLLVRQALGPFKPKKRGGKKKK